MNFVRKLFVLTVIVVASGLLYGQNTIKGNIIDGKTKEAVAFCNVMQYADTAEQSPLLDGCISKENGSFIMSLNKKTKYIRLSFIGYGTINIDLEKEGKKSGTTILLNNILLYPESSSLSTVEIFAQQKRFEMTNDGVAMNIDQDVSSSSSNAFELLRKVPGVVIDKDENIQLNGKSGILFQIDGRDIRIPYAAIKAMLKSMSPSEIDKIETINNPSAKYEAEGTAGIINIKRVKQESLGWSGELSSWAGYDNELKLNEGANLNYVSNRWTLNSSLSFNKWTGKQESWMENRIFTEPQTLIKSDTLTTKMDYRAFNANISADYKISDKSSMGGMFSFNGGGQPYKQNPRQYSRISHSPFELTDSSYFSSNAQKSSDRSIAANLWYSRKIDTVGGQYSFTLDYNNNVSKDYCYDDASYFLGNFEQLYTNGADDDSTKNRYNTYSAKFDIIKSWNDKITMEAGLKSRLTMVNNDFRCYTDGEKNMTTSNELDYKENVNAAYVSLTDKLTERLSLRLGLRMEHTYTNIKQKVNNSEKSKNYVNFFPNVNLNCKIGKMDNLSLVYSYRITRPEYNTMNPFTEKENEYLFKSGNPDLKPQYTHSINLSYAFHYFVFLTASYDYTKDLITDSRILRPNSIVTEEMPRNMGHTQNFSLGLSTALPLGKHVEWVIWMQGIWQKTDVDDEALKIDMSNSAFMTWQSMKIDFFFKTKLSLSAGYMGGMTQGTYSIGSMCMFDVNLSREFLDRSLKVSAGVGHFPKKTMHITMESASMRNKVNTIAMYPMVSCSVSYSFGKKHNNNTLQRIKSEDMEERTGSGVSVGQTEKK